METLLALTACAWLGLAGAPPAAEPAAPDDPPGLAARYPADKGIEADPNVVIHEDFEDAARTFDSKRWTGISNKGEALKIVSEPGNIHGGKQALQVTATLGTNTGGHLFTRFAKGYEQLYTRFCVKFAPDCDYIHHFVSMVAELPASPWPTGGAGLRPSGDRKFSVAIEPWSFWGKVPPPGGWHFYNYWHKMKAGPDGKFWGQGPAREPFALAERGRWYCVEFMAACNTPGKDDGRLGLWIDGKRLAQYSDVNWRTSERLQLNSLWLMLYVTENSARKNRVNTVWFDDVVVARKYIGPPKLK